MAYIAIKNELAGRAFKAFKKNLHYKRMKKLSVVDRRRSLLSKATKSIIARVDKRKLA